MGKYRVVIETIVAGRDEFKPPRKTEVTVEASNEQEAETSALKDAPRHSSVLEVVSV